MLQTGRGRSLYFLNMKIEKHNLEKYNVALSYLVFFVPNTGRLDFRKYGVDYTT